MFISFSNAAPAPTTWGGKLLRLVGRLVFLWLAALLVACLIAVGLIVLVLSLARALFTGRKPSPGQVFGNFKRYAPQGMWPGAARDAAPSDSARPVSPLASSRPSGSPRTSDVVVDVEAREIPPNKAV